MRTAATLPQRAAHRSAVRPNASGVDAALSPCCCLFHPELTTISMLTTTPPPPSLMPMLGPL
jgi:hypothetical protein